MRRPGVTSLGDSRSGAGVVEINRHETQQRRSNVRLGEAHALVRAECGHWVLCRCGRCRRRRAGHRDVCKGRQGSALQSPWHPRRRSPMTNDDDNDNGDGYGLVPLSRNMIHSSRLAGQVR